MAGIISRNLEVGCDNTHCAEEWDGDASLAACIAAPTNSCRLGCERCIDRFLSKQFTEEVFRDQGMDIVGEDSIDCLERLV